MVKRLVKNVNIRLSIIASDRSPFNKIDTTYSETLEQRRFQDRINHSNCNISQTSRNRKR